MKVLDSKKSNASSIQREIAVLQRLKHANLVELREVLDDPKDSKVYLVMELVERGELIGDVMSVPPFGDTTARRYFRDVLCGLAYLHLHGVIHCDLKVGTRRVLRKVETVGFYARYTPVGVLRLLRRQGP